ncbi:MAG TPA: type I-C CRISPR-associated endonuclease Cas1c [Chitinispirillaceae bacterium]|nr:type I-C CRISPR-associated endonuclease Cas1c [Chitinispirillaceae bacterium]
MKRLLNTLYITTHGAYIAKEGMTVTIRIEHEVKMRLPVHTLNGIVCFGGVAVSPDAMELCADNNVTISFLGEYGHFKARVVGQTQGNVLLRREQYRRADDEKKAGELARSFIIAKIANARNVVLRAIREKNDITGTEECEIAARKMLNVMRQLKAHLDNELLLGKEGEAARIYFNIFNELICAQKEHFIFKGRSRRPPLDLVNSLLSFVYTLLVHDATAALETVGLDPYVGFFHKDRPGRPGLALDLMEEFRGYIADRLVLTLINTQQVKQDGFTVTESGGILMDEQTRKTVISAYQKRKQEEVKHPFLQETMPVGMLIFSQAMLLARHLRGDLDKYPAFFSK